MAYENIIYYYFILGKTFFVVTCRTDYSGMLSAGITGHVELDDNLDRLGEYSVWHKPSFTADYQPFVDIKMKSSHIDDIVT